MIDLRAAVPRNSKAGDHIRTEFNHSWMSLFRSKTYNDPSLNAGCTEFEVNNWTISEFVMERIVPVVGIRPFPLNELMLMVSAVCRFKPAKIFEWGTHFGKSARVFRETINTFGIPCMIHSVDLPEDVQHGEHPHADRGKLVRGMKEVLLHQGDGLTCALEILANDGQNGRILFFVDGDHSHASVTREFRAILEHVPDAIVLLHDTFLQSGTSGYNIGPHEAINEVLADRNGKYRVITTNTGLPGMTLVFPTPIGN